MTPLSASKPAMARRVRRRALPGPGRAGSAASGTGLTGSAASGGLAPVHRLVGTPHEIGGRLLLAEFDDAGAEPQRSLAPVRSGLRTTLAYPGHHRFGLRHRNARQQQGKLVAAETKAAIDVSPNDIAHRAGKLAQDLIADLVPGAIVDQ